MPVVGGGAPFRRRRRRRHGRPRARAGAPARRSRSRRGRGPTSRSMPRRAGGPRGAGWRRRWSLGLGDPAGVAAARRREAGPADLRHARPRWASTRRPRPRGFEYAIGRRPGFLDGRPGPVVDGQRAPVPGRADVRRRRGRRGADAHRRTPAARCTRCTCTATTRWCWPATGSRRPAARGGWTRSTSATGRSYDIAFVADNPGIWMDHCHNLPHAAEGLVAHLMYEGVTTPYRVGGARTNRSDLPARRVAAYRAGFRVTISAERARCA